MTAPDNLLAEDQAPDLTQNDISEIQTETVEEVAVLQPPLETVQELSVATEKPVVTSSSVPPAPKLRLTSDAELFAQIAKELKVRPEQVAAAAALLDEGATVPFIARYRKEAHGLDDTQLRELESRLTYLRELDERRSKVIESIRSQGKLTETLLERLNGAENKNTLEDLYALPPETNQ